jgi:hypothetical protein
MALSTYIGLGKAADGREAGAQAALGALNLAGRSPLIFGILIASHNLPFDQVLSGAIALLGDTPLIGFTTTAEIHSGGIHQRSVVIALISGTDVTAQSEFWSGYGEDSRGTSLRMIQSLPPLQSNSTLFVVADGFHGDPRDLCSNLPAGGYTLAGCLAGGELRQAHTFQLGGRQSGSGGLAAALLSGKIISSVGLGHGWEEVGAYFQIDRVRGQWIRTLNNQTAADAYARWLGYPPREWSFPPLNELVRLYPLGIEKGDKKDLLVRSPLRMESDGSLRMHTNISEGDTAHLLVGNIESCLRSAANAAANALKNLGKARPFLGIILPDISWQILLETQPGSDVAAVQNVLGPNVPIIGGYTYGQFANPNRTAEFYNQHIEVILLAEAADQP